MVADGSRKCPWNNYRIYNSVFCYRRCSRQLVLRFRTCILGFQALHWWLQLLQANSPTWWNILDRKIPQDFANYNWSSSLSEHISFSFCNSWTWNKRNIDLVLLPVVITCHTTIKYLHDNWLNKCHFINIKISRIFLGRT